MLWAAHYDYSAHINPKLYLGQDKKKKRMKNLGKKWASKEHPSILINSHLTTNN